jgi:hypothetical protein
MPPHQASDRAPLLPSILAPLPWCVPQATGDAALAGGGGRNGPSPSRRLWPHATLPQVGLDLPPPLAPCQHFFLPLIVFGGPQCPAQAGPHPGPHAPLARRCLLALPEGEARPFHPGRPSPGWADVKSKQSTPCVRCWLRRPKARKAGDQAWTGGATAAPQTPPEWPEPPEGYGPACGATSPQIPTSQPGFCLSGYYSAAECARRLRMVRGRRGAGRSNGVGQRGGAQRRSAAVARAPPPRAERVVGARRPQPCRQPGIGGAVGG